jgi:hypothetical protein
VSNLYRAKKSSNGFSKGNGSAFACSLPCYRVGAWAGVEWLLMPTVFFYRSTVAAIIFCFSKKLHLAITAGVMYTSLNTFHMSTVLVAAVLVGIIAAICLILVGLDKKQKRIAMNQLLHAFHQKGSEHNLTFSGQEILSESILGLDGMNRKVLVLDKTAENGFNSFVIDLNEVKSCSVKKAYGTINGGDLKAKMMEQYLQTITLHFVLYDKPPADVVFYNHIGNHIYQIAELESKAKHWEALLSKVIGPLKKIA